MQWWLPNFPFQYFTFLTLPWLDLLLCTEYKIIRTPSHFQSSSLIQRVERTIIIMQDVRGAVIKTCKSQYKRHEQNNLFHCSGSRNWQPRRSGGLFDCGSPVKRQINSILATALKPWTVFSQWDIKGSVSGSFTKELIVRSVCITGKMLPYNLWQIPLRERGLWWRWALWHCFSLSPRRSLTSPVKQKNGNVDMLNPSQCANTLPQLKDSHTHTKKEVLSPHDCELLETAGRKQFLDHEKG